MAKKTRTSRRIEPSFEDGGQPGDLRLSARDRVAAGGPRKAAAKRKAATARPGRSAAKARSAGRRRGSRRRGGGSGPGRLVRRGLYWCCVLGIWGAIGLAGLFAYYAAQMPSATTWAIPDRPPNVKILSRGGRTMANRGATGGEALSLNAMSPYIPQAVIAIEDRRFYAHPGVDPIGLARALLANLREGGTVQGGSTLTQQLAKNLFLSPDRTIERKVQEVLLALWLERRFSKDQILTMYLNRVYFGSGAYGVEAAARRYFHKPASEVNLAEAALLAGLLKAPSRLSPARDPKAAEARAQVVLEAMRTVGFVTDREMATAMTRPPTEARSYWSGAEHYVADMVMDELEMLIGEVTTDLVVETTVDLALVKAAEAAVAEAIAEDGTAHEVSQGALVALDGTGAIRALVGGRDYAESQFNRAASARRQPGSAFKPFVYAAALEMGRGPHSVRNDAPVRIGRWTPDNYGGKYRGPLTLAEALKHSSNSVAAQLVMEVGPQRVIETARRLGIESDVAANASIALGTSEVRLTELTAGFAPFMNGGFRAEPHVIDTIRRLDGTLLYERGRPQPRRVLDPAVVGAMNAMLAGVVEGGTGRAAQIAGWPSGGKTGTTQNSRDALFVGYTARLTAGLWFGNDDGTPMKGVTGGGLPARTWQIFMARAHAGLEPTPLPYVGAAFPPGGTAPSARRPIPQQSVPGAPAATAAPDAGNPVAAAPPGAGSDDPGRIILEQLTGAVPAPAVTETGSATSAPAAPDGAAGVRPLARPLPRPAETDRPRPPADLGAAPPRRETTLLDMLLGN